MGVYVAGILNIVEYFSKNIRSFTRLGISEKLFKYKKFAKLLVIPIILNRS